MLDVCLAFDSLFCYVHKRKFSGMEHYIREALRSSLTITLLTLYCLACSVGHAEPKFRLQFKKGSSNKNNPVSVATMSR